MRIENGFMSSVLLYHHLGLGDHFICHGIVRDHCERYARVGLFVKPRNRTSVAAMYRDLPNLALIPADDRAALRFIWRNRFAFGDRRWREVKTIGHQLLDHRSGEQFERQFYRLAGVDFEKKWSTFHISRDEEREEALIRKLSPKTPYLFLHEDAGRGYAIDRARLPPGLSIAVPERGVTENIIDYCGLFERAAEIHVIDSSFMFLIDCLPYDDSRQKLFVHRYARENPLWTLPILKKRWTILA